MNEDLLWSVGHKAVTANKVRSNRIFPAVMYCRQLNDGTLSLCF